MAQTASMEVSQGSSPENLIIEDDTANPEVYTDRILTILDSAGDELADYPNPINFSVADFPTNIITLTGFTVDMALNIVMLQTVASPVGGSTYTATSDIAMNRYLQQGEYNIQEAMFVEQALPAKAGVQAQYNTMSIIIEARNSQTAVLYGSLTGAQEALDRGQNIINNQIM